MNRLDRTGKRRRWTLARASESHYNSRLLGVARQVGQIVKGLAPDGSLRNAQSLVKALHDYAELLEPWAQSVATYMLADVGRKDFKMWKAHTKEMSRALRLEIENAPTGQVLRGLQESQVKLIQSIPLDAAQRVHELAVDATITGTRAAEISKQILATQNVSEAKARLIARTETSRAASNFVQARAEWAGSDGYIWRTSGDFDVRKSHSEMEGKYVRWGMPPTLDGLKGHAGCLPNCRCFAEPVFPDF